MTSIHKLILIEGLPGSGKSTTGQRLARELRNKHISAKWYYEDELEHPTDHQNEAYLSNDEYDAFTNKINPIVARAIESVTKCFDDYYLINFHKLSRDFPDLQLRDELSGYNVFTSSTERFMQAFQHKWREFSSMSIDSVTVLDASFLQLPLIALLLINDEKDEVILDHVKRVGNISSRLDPLLIYFENPNVEAAIERIFSIRGDRWKEYIIGMIENSKYSRSRGLSGIEAVMRYFKHRYALEQQIISQLKLKVIRINKSEGTWDEYWQSINRYFDLNPSSVDDDVNALAPYVGKYIDMKNREMNIHIRDNHLYANHWKLVEEKPKIYAIEGHCAELIFDLDRNRNQGVGSIVIGGYESCDFPFEAGSVFSRMDT